MNHTFTQSQLNPNKCALCPFSAEDHTDRATCEVCSRSGSLEPYIDMLFCADCIKKERDAQAELVRTAHERVEAERNRGNSVLALNKQIEAGIQISQDIFNSKMISIAELKTAIDNDPSIENKHFELSKVLDARFTHLAAVLLEVTEAQKQALNEQRAIQTFYTDLAKKLRGEEREQIKLKDLTYIPIPPKAVTTRKITVKKYDKAAIRSASDASKIPEQLIQMTCIGRNITPLEAVRILRESGL